MLTNPYFLALYMTAGVHTALLLMMFGQRPPWSVILLMPFLWPALVPVILFLALIDRTYDQLRRKRWLGMVVMLGLASAAPATEWGVDDRWYHPADSHHAAHAGAGAALGAASYATAAALGANRPRRYACALAWVALAAVLWEVWEDGRSDGNYADPADVAWTVGGAAAGAAVADLVDCAIVISPRPDGAAVAVAWRW